MVQRNCFEKLYVKQLTERKSRGTRAKLKTNKKEVGPLEGDHGLTGKLTAGRRRESRSGDGGKASSK